MLSRRHPPPTTPVSHRATDRERTRQIGRLVLPIEPSTLWHAGAETDRSQGAPISGVRYETPTHHGVTDRAGGFRYAIGESVTFSIGGTVLGTVCAQTSVSPLEFVADARMLRALVLSQAALGPQ